MAEQRETTEALDRDHPPAAAGDAPRVSAATDPGSRAAADPTDDLQNPLAALESQPPRVLGGRYLLEELLARGGMASVWRAHDEKLARTVAVKVLHRHLSDAEDFRERFRREAISAAKLSHPGIVGVYDTGADGSWVYLVMEYVEGATLADLLADSSSLDAGVVARVGERVATALASANALGVVHRDVKPANILIDRSGQPKVTDFGIAKAESAGSDLTRTGMVLGTAAYLAPEQVRGDRVDHRADQYALGCVLYEALTGQKPFSAETSMEVAAQRLRRDPADIRSLRVGVPRDLANTIMRSLRRDPDERWPDNAVFASALRGFATDELPTISELGYGGQPYVVEDKATTDGSRVATEDRPATRHSFLRSEGRWIGAVLLMLVAAAVAVGIGLFTGVIDATGIPTMNALEVGPDDPADVEEPVALEIGADQLSVFDPPDPGGGFPGGDGQENNAELGNAVDGDPETAWQTDAYRSTATFGNLKEGLGLIVDLGESRPVTGVRVTTTTPGLTVAMRAADERSDALSDWSTVGDPVTIEDSETITAAEPVPARYVMIWVTGELPSAGQGRWRGAISELEVLGPPA